METHSCRRRGEVAPCVSFLPLFPKKQVRRGVCLGQAKTDDLLCDDKGEVAGWSLSLGAAALGEFSVASFPRFL